MSIKETYDEYKDQWGMVQVNKGGAVTQNGPRFTGEYVAALIRHKELDENTKAELRGTLELIEFPEGNLHRFPTSDEQQSVDDTVATLWWSAMVDDSFAHRWLMRGQESPTSYSSDIRFPFENKWWWRKLAFPILKALGIFKYTLHTAHPGQFSFDALVRLARAMAILKERSHTQNRTATGVIFQKRVAKLGEWLAAAAIDESNKEALTEAISLFQTL
jgi:hypothetical protein